MLKIMWNVFKELLYKVKRNSTYNTHDLIIWKLSNYTLYKQSGICKDFFNKIIVVTATILLRYALSRKYTATLKSYLCVIRALPSTNENKYMLLKK